MKYIDAERLMAEIERKIAQYSNWAEEEWEDDREYNHGAWGAFKNVRLIIDSLQQEQPEMDLEEAAEESWIYYEYRDPGHLYSSVYKDAFKAGAEWNAEHFRDTTKKVSEDLEEAAEEYADYNSRRWHEDGDIYYDHSKIQDAFLAGADWQKEQMMKDAVEGEIVKDISNKLAVTAKNTNLDGFKFGDKVRVIIVKEEEK